jgi:hypothetical protein
VITTEHNINEVPGEMRKKIKKWFKNWSDQYAACSKAVKKYVAKCLELYEAQAKEMQGSLKTYAWESKEKVFSYWALNDVGTCLYILGKANEAAGNKDAAREAYQKLVNEFKFAQCWDPAGWFWKPAEDAEKKLNETGKADKSDKSS